MKKITRIVSAFFAVVVGCAALAGSMTASAETVSDYASTDYARQSATFQAIMSKYTGEEVVVTCSKDQQPITVKYEGDTFTLKDAEGNAPYVRESVDTSATPVVLGNKLLDENGKEIPVTVADLGLNAEYPADKTVKFPLPAAYSEGNTLRMKYILDASVIKEKYADYTFILPFCGADIAVPGSYLAGLKGEGDVAAERVEFSFKAVVPFKADPINSGAELDVIRCASSIIKGEKPHPVVGDYVFDFSIYVNSTATYDVGTDIKVTINANKEQFSAAASAGKVSYQVYAYLDKDGKVASATTDNMNAKVDEANATATFTLQNIGWFFLAADNPSDVEGVFPMWAIILIIAAVVVIAAVIVVIIILNKKKTSAAQN